MSLVHSVAQEGSAVPTCDVPKTVADILTAAADLIERPGGWTQGVFARDANGCNAGWRQENAECFCVSGALSRVGGHPEFNLAWQAFNSWTMRRGFPHLAKWNDAPERTQAEVVAALRAAAKKARTAVEGPTVGTSNASEPKPLPTNGDSQ